MISEIGLENFDADPVAPRPRLRVVKTYTEAETREMVRAAHERGLREGLEEGYAAGQSETRQAVDRDLSQALDAVSKQLDTLLDGVRSHRAALETQVLEFALSVCDAVFPELVERTSTHRAAAQIRQALKMAIGSAAIRIRLAPATRDALAQELEQRTRYYRLDDVCRIEAVPDLRPGEVHLEWDNGALDYAFEVVTARILEELRRTHARAAAIAEAAAYGR